jgi:hypothetical protein
VSGLRKALAFLRPERFAPSADSHNLDFEYTPTTPGIEFGGPQHLKPHQV